MKWKEGEEKLKLKEAIGEKSEESGVMKINCDRDLFDLAELH